MKNANVERITYTLQMFPKDALSSSSPLFNHDVEIEMSGHNHFFFQYFLKTGRYFEEEIDESWINASKKLSLNIIEKLKNDEWKSLGDEILWLRRLRGYKKTDFTHDDLVKFVHPIHWAAYHGYFETFQFINEFDFGYRYSAEYAAKGGNLPLLKWIVDHGGELTEYVPEEAASNGHLDVLKWLYKRVKFSHFVILYAADNGHIDIIKWLEYKEKHIPMTTSFHAGTYGHVEIIEFMIEKGYKLEPMTESDIAKFGRLDLLKQIHEKKLLNISEHASIGAARGGHVHVLEWLLEKGYPIPKHIDSIALESQNYSQKMFKFTRMLKLKK